MRRLIAYVLIASVVMVAVAAPPSRPALAQAGTCQLAPVFLLFRDLVGRERVGECTGLVTRSELGDLSQPTTRGTLTLRMSDLVVAFSDGQTTWLAGPRGVESRPATARLPWETAADPRAGLPGSGLPGSGLPGSGPPGTAPAGAGAPALPPTPTPLPPPPTPTPTPPPSDQPVTLEGTDTTTSEPFTLAGGEYTAAWQARLPSGRSSCYVGSRLRRAEDTNPGSLVVHTTLNTSNDRSVAGETRLFAVAPGRYVLDVMTTGCQWSIEIMPRR